MRGSGAGWQQEGGPYRRGSQSRSRSPGRSPVRGGGGGRGGARAPQSMAAAGPGGGRDAAAAKRRYSRSRSPDRSDSRSTSTSGGSGDEPQPKRRGSGYPAAGPKGGAPQRPAQQQQQLAAHGAGLQDLHSRVQQLEVSLSQERAAHDADRTKLAFVSEKVRSVAERSRNRGSTLVRLLAALRHSERAKQAVTSAQAAQRQADVDLAEVVLQATAMMEGEEAAFAGPQPPAGNARDDPGPAPAAIAAAALPSTSHSRTVPTAGALPLLLAGGVGGDGVGPAAVAAPAGATASNGPSAASAAPPSTLGPAAGLGAGSGSGTQAQAAARGGWTQGEAAPGAAAAPPMGGKPMSGLKFKLNVV